ncbi:unnamed protein product, partial [Ectocarpus sp. 13 AM-2016]
LSLFGAYHTYFRLYEVPRSELRRKEMLRPRDHPVEPGGGSDDEGNDAASSGVCYDAMSSFNVTVSLGHKTPSPPAGSAASRQTGPRHTRTSRFV